ncbi:MAG TPA: PAS domain-containing protein [Candidatus Angelobacter sp.]|nr:PAS domain-containing protein [Candidatus Angelobacter sp.]
MPGRNEATPKESLASRQEASLDQELAELRYQLTALYSRPAENPEQLGQESSRLREACYRALLELSPQSVWMSDPEGNCTYSNRYWHEFSGMTAEETSRRGWVQAVHPDDVSGVRAAWRQALASGGNFEEELRFRRGFDGQYRWHLCRGVPLRDGQGQIEQWLGVSVDIHDRKMAQEAIDQANERTRLAVEAADIGTWDFYPATGVIEASPRCLEIFARPNEKTTRDDFFAAVHRDDRARVAETLARALDPVIAGPYEIEYRIVHPGGKVRWIYAKGKSFFSEAGASRTATRFSGMLIDVTRQRAMERDRASLAAALQNSPDIIGITDIRGRVLFLNRAAQELVGLHSDEEARTKTALDFLAPAEREVVLNEMLPTVMGGKVWEREFTMRHMVTGEPILVETRVFGIFDENKRLTRMVNLSRDISEKRKLDERLHMAQKMEAVGRLAGGIAHDFNNLLTIIRGAAEMLTEKIGATSAGPILKEIVAAAERASTLTDELLAFGRQKVVQPRAISLNRAVLNMQSMLQRLAGEDVGLHLELAEDLYNVKMDPVQVDQILINLVANARDAMPHGGEIRICTSNQRPGGDDRDGVADYACLSFSDNGQGMPQEALKHIFEPFFSTKREGKNGGLGLATVYGIVQQADGHIEAHSGRGKGTQFTIFLPRTLEELDLREPAGLAVPTVDGGTILLVEDESSLRTILAAYLRERGYQIYEAGDAQEATAVAEKHRIDLLLTDIVMPGISGAGLASSLSKTQPHIKIIFMSGYADHAELQAALRRKNAVFLHKPFRFGDLMPRIREALAAREAAPQKKN